MGKSRIDCGSEFLNFKILLYFPNFSTLKTTSALHFFFYTLKRLMVF